jgi:hypothetical protein
MLTNEEAGKEHGPTSGNALDQGALLDVKHIKSPKKNNYVC